MPRLLGNPNIPDQTSANNAHTASLFYRQIDDLADAVNMRRKGCHQDFAGGVRYEILNRPCHNTFRAG